MELAVTRHHLNSPILNSSPGNVSESWGGDGVIEAETLVEHLYDVFEQETCSKAPPETHSLAVAFCSAVEVCLRTHIRVCHEVPPRGIVVPPLYIVHKEIFPVCFRIPPMITEYLEECDVSYPMSTIHQSNVVDYLIGQMASCRGKRRPSPLRKQAKRR